MHDLATIKANNKSFIEKQRDQNRETLRSGGVVNIYVKGDLTPCLTVERYNEHCAEIDRGWDEHVRESQRRMQALWHRTPGAKSATTA